MKKTELKHLIKEIITEGDTDVVDTDAIMQSLFNVSYTPDLYNICNAIAPKSVASGMSRRQLLDIIRDVLLSRS
jgi:hypothetical protein